MNVSPVPSVLVAHFEGSPRRGTIVYTPYMVGWDFSFLPEVYVPGPPHADWPYSTLRPHDSRNRTVTEGHTDASRSMYVLLAASG